MNCKCNFRHVEKLRIIVSCFVISATDTFKSLEQNQPSYQLQRRSGIALMKYSKGIKLRDPHAFAPPQPHRFGLMATPDVSRIYGI